MDDKHKKLFEEFILISGGKKNGLMLASRAIPASRFPSSPMPWQFCASTPPLAICSLTTRCCARSC